MNQLIILVVDDEFYNFDVIESFLSRLNYQLLYASSAKEALESLELGPIDLILLDVMMPEMNGIEVCSLIKSHPQWAKIPIIMVTALTGKDDLARCLQAGADDFISKPVNSLELRARVQSMLRIKQQYDALQTALERQAILEAEKRDLLENRNFELEKEVELRTASLRATTELITYNAFHDPLTNLPNRRLLLERLDTVIKQAQRSNIYNYAILFLDLDQFKIINDSLGHLIGDQLLISMASKLKTNLEEKYLIARFGGDEFMILLENMSGIEEIIKITEQILDNFKTAIMVNKHQIFVNASIGIVLGNPHYFQANDLIRDADIAMYKAKHQGRNLYKIFDNKMHEQAVNRLTLENDLRRALEQEEFMIYYQPIIDINSDRLIGFEALIRWQHPSRGFISPIEFIPIAEETGLIVEIGSWILKTACQQLALWKNKFPQYFPLKVSINLSAQDLRKVNLIDEIENTLATTGLDANYITLEITESMLIDDINQTIDLLKKLKSRNIQISIDDFGTGYSSLNYLYLLPADYLKIDRSFVTLMQQGNRNYQVVNTIINLSDQLGLQVIAEGIETTEQLQWLKQLGCEFGQGYLFSQPLSVLDVETKIFQIKHR